MDSNKYTIKTYEETSKDPGNISTLSEQAWPEFLRHADDLHWNEIYNRFADYQLLFYDNENLIGVGNTVPLYWDQGIKSLPGSIEDILLLAIDCQEKKCTPNTLSALAVMISDAYQGKGFSSKILMAMKQLAMEHNHISLIVPVRPTLKSRHPLMSFEQYINWRRDDGSPVDPWLRVHWKLGASVLKIIPKALTVQGSIADWMSWTGKQFPRSGDYRIKGALQPVRINEDLNHGIYYDPNLWMLHNLEI